jgi:hypothetical protein
MAASGFVPDAAFSLQYPNLTPSHAEYAKIGTRSGLTMIDYYFVKFKHARRWPENSSGKPSPAQLQAYERDVMQLGDLLYHLITEVGLSKDATASFLLTPGFSLQKYIRLGFLKWLAFDMLHQLIPLSAQSALERIRVIRRSLTNEIRAQKVHWNVLVDGLKSVKDFVLQCLGFE